MATFLFWNINRKPLGEAVFRLVELHQVDVLMLAESPMSAGALLVSLNRDATQWSFPASTGSKLQLLTRFSRAFVRSLLERPRWTIREMQLPGVPPVNIVLVHLPDKGRASDASQFALCCDLARDIKSIEEQVGHQRTLVVGDFNMNPFEDGMLSANGLHAETTRAIAGKLSRRVNEQEHRYFYNPMWNFFGDATRGPAGTYYFRRAEMVRMSWNMFDQVLLRPALFSHFAIADLEILEGDGERSFLTRSGTPTTQSGSDHLPVLFKLNL